LKTFVSMIIVAGLCLTAAGVAIRADHQHAGENLKDAKWSAAPPLLPKGAEIVVLDGDPTKPVLYTVRLKFPAHYAIPAHSHPTDEHVVVTSGALVFGMGDVLDKGSNTNTKLTVGGFVNASANVNHFAFTRDEETTIVLYGVGPIEFKYVNPNDDPRNHAKDARPRRNIFASH
jgi:quercetin dioxygenase-like cupin family protein